jgi:hypothetical protein
MPLIAVNRLMDYRKLKDDMRDGLIDLLNRNGLSAINVDEFLDDIFYNNGKNFVLNRIKLMRGLII